MNNWLALVAYLCLIGSNRISQWTPTQPLHCVQLQIHTPTVFKTGKGNRYDGWVRLASEYWLARCIWSFMCQDNTCATLLSKSKARQNKIYSSEGLFLPGWPHQWRQVSAFAFRRIYSLAWVYSMYDTRGIRLDSGHHSPRDRIVICTVYVGRPGWSGEGKKIVRGYRGQKRGLTDGSSVATNEVQDYWYFGSRISSRKEIPLHPWTTWMLGDWGASIRSHRTTTIRVE